MVIRETGGCDGGCQREQLLLLVRYYPIHSCGGVLAPTTGGGDLGCLGERSLRPLPLLGHWAERSKTSLLPLPWEVSATNLGIASAGEGGLRALPLLAGEYHSSLPLPFLGGEVAMFVIMSLRVLMEKGRNS